METRLSNQNKYYPRERHNPMYTGMESRVTPSGNKPPAQPTRTKDIMRKNCACAMLSLLIVCIIISLLSLIIVVLFGIGAIQSPTSADKNLTSELAAYKILMKEKFEETKIKFNATLQEYKSEIQRLNDSIVAIAKNQSKVSQSEIVRLIGGAIASLTPEEVYEIFGNRTDTSLTRCRYETYSFGISSSQTEVDTGEFYADEDYVITGVTCSSSDGYLASLRSRELTDDDVRRNNYRCHCVRTNGVETTSSGRANCEIHYWQCPTSVIS